MNKTTITVKHIDALLPQTQCGLCGYAGCKPYAQAILEKNEAIDRCLPGGVETLKALGTLTHHDPTPLIPTMQKKAKSPTVAWIREADCIGCTKCIQACPVDAIVGSTKKMHTVIADFCTGCELCLPPCPMDCIELHPINPPNDPKAKAHQARDQYHARQQRLSQQRPTPEKPLSTHDRHAEINAAIKRVQQKRKPS